MFLKRILVASENWKGIKFINETYNVKYMGCLGIIAPEAGI